MGSCFDGSSQMRVVFEPIHTLIHTHTNPYLLKNSSATINRRNRKGLSKMLKKIHSRNETSVSPRNVKASIGLGFMYSCLV
jgi:hypothetical protein